MPQMTNEREYRDFTLEVKVPDTEEEKTMVVEGYASTFNEPYELYADSEVRILEQVDPNAFDEADMSDVIFQYDHRGRVFARMSNGTLDVNPDEHGLAIRADLGGTDIGRQLYEEIRGGYTTKMSYGYTVAADRWDETRGEDGVLTEIRTITKISKVYDVSAVSLPANDGTSITVRNLTDGVIEKVKAERLKALELRRRKTMMLLELGGF
jgi:HK97 family phage prohead protease